jgi:hypothetical protein
MRINIISGRTFNDSDLMPLFPSIVLEGSASQCEGEEIGCVSAECFFLPSCCEGGLEAVYSRRKFLEEKFDQIPAFIDAYFGVKIMKVQPHRPVFTKTHPQRRKKVLNLGLDSDIVLLKNSSVVFCSLIAANPQDFVLNVITEDKSIRVHIFFKKEVEIKSEALAKLSKGEFSDWQQYITIFQKEKSTVTVLCPGSPPREITLPLDTEFVACADEGDFLYSPSPMTVWIKGHKLCETVSAICGLTVNPTFKMFAVATIDGNVAVYSLSSGEMSKRSFVGGEVKFLCSTGKWGFVVAFTDLEIVVLDVNGEVVKRASCPWNIVKIFPFSSVADFDYICFETDRQHLVFFEVFYPENALVFTQSPEESMFISYSSILSSFLIVTRTGKLRVMRRPHNLNLV